MGLNDNQDYCDHRDGLHKFYFEPVQLGLGKVHRYGWKSLLQVFDISFIHLCIKKDVFRLIWNASGGIFNMTKKSVLTEIFCNITQKLGKLVKGDLNWLSLLREKKHKSLKSNKILQSYIKVPIHSVISSKSYPK